MAQLDRLGSAKDVAQIGAAIGRESPRPSGGGGGEPGAELGSALDRLIAAELLFRQGVPPQATYLFKHALVQDAAYGTLLREARRGLHARIAEVLEGQFTEIATNQPELLAHRCTEAELIERAVGLWGKADKRSLERSALVEAVEQLAETHAAMTHSYSRNYAAAKGEAEELAALAGDKGAFFWKAIGTVAQGWVSALTGEPSRAAELLTFGLDAFRTTGSTLWIPLHMSCLAIAYRDLDRFDEAGTASAMRRRRSRPLGKDGTKPKSCGSPVRLQ